jgi:hypothetical protein
MALLWFCYYKTEAAQADAVREAQRRMAWLLGEPPALQFSRRIDSAMPSQSGSQITWLECLRLDVPAQRNAWERERERACIASGLRAITQGQEHTEWFEPCA